MFNPRRNGTHNIPTSAGSRADDLRLERPSGDPVHRDSPLGHTFHRPPEDDRLLRSRDAAEYLAISERKLWELSAGNEIPVVRCGRLVRYCVTDLQAWIARHREGGRRAS